MADNQRPTAEQLADQIRQYVDVRPSYKRFADSLKSVFEKSCKLAIPEAIVQARAKSVSSFAEKCVRKYDRYKDPVRQFTDLCGARVIVQTLNQVQAVCEFVEHNFDIREKDEKGLLLNEDRFGYRDMHYLIRLIPENAKAIGFTHDQIRDIGDKIAELQVRSLVQHSWADILHDRMYKAPLKLSTENKRNGALLAAIMEEGDRNFDRLAGELDGMSANYSAYAQPKDVEDEIKTQRLLLENARTPDEKIPLALKLAQLIAPRAQWDQIITILSPFENAGLPQGTRVQIELANALCCSHRSSPQSPEYQKGLALLNNAVVSLSKPDHNQVNNIRRDRSLKARAQARLGWAYEVCGGMAKKARECYRNAVENEPTNPYYLTEMLGYELSFTQDKELASDFTSTMRKMAEVCQQHEIAGTQLPWAFFCAGRLGLLLKDPHAALSHYALGIRHCVKCQSDRVECLFNEEVNWLERVYNGQDVSPAFQWVIAFFKLAIKARAVKIDPKHPKTLIIAGGAKSIPKEQLPELNAFFAEILDGFKGNVISGGTKSGVPGAVGGVPNRSFKLIGYIPESLPVDVDKDSRYDQLIPDGKDFFPIQPLKYWNDLLDQGADPAQVILLVYGGRKTSAFECRLAHALGAKVCPIVNSGGAADEFLKDALCMAGSNPPYTLPKDAKTIHTFIMPSENPFTNGDLEAMARQFHAAYVDENKHKIKPESLRPWEKLPETYKKANIDQAASAIQILKAAGFGVRKAKAKPAIFKNFTNAEIERMAELEHARWNVERLNDGWRYNKLRDNDKKHHDCILPWTDVPDGIDGVKIFDRQAVKNYPAILALVGWEVYRLRKTRRLAAF